MELPYYEYKFIIPVSSLHFVRSFLQSAYRESDPYSSGVVYSLYFDTPDMKCVRESRDGHFCKRKFRLRGYEAGSVSQLQVKEKKLLSVRKWKIPLSDFSALGDSFARLQHEEAGEIGGILKAYWGLSAIASISYQRERFRSLGQRITLDRDISVEAARGFAGRCRTAARWPFGILELKTNSERPTLPLFRMLELQQVSFSKLTFGIGLLCSN